MEIEWENSSFNLFYLFVIYKPEVKIEKRGFGWSCARIFDRKGSSFQLLNLNIHEVLPYHSYLFNASINKSFGGLYSQLSCWNCGETIPAAQLLIKNIFIFSHIFSQLKNEQEKEFVGVRKDYSLWVCVMISEAFLRFHKLIGNKPTVMIHVRIEVHF